MKRLLFILLALTLIFTTASCANEKKSSSNVKEPPMKAKEEINDTVSDEPSENEIVTEIPSVDTIPEVKVPTETPSNNTVTTDIKFTPKVIASRCTHDYLPPTCTSLVPCTICGELLSGLYFGQKIEYGHIYQNNKCIHCGFERKDTLELNGSFFSTNQTITVDISLMTDEKEIEIYPCVTLYKYVNGNWKPYQGMYTVGEFFALEATQGEVLVSNCMQYGRWDYMNNNILKTDPNALVETDFAPSRLIRRFQILIPEKGEYKIEVTNGPNDSKKDSNKIYHYIINTY